MNSWTIRQRLHLGFIVLVACTVALGAVNLFENRQIAQALDRLARQGLPGVVRTSQLEAQVLRFRVAVLKHIVVADPATMQRFEQEADDIMGQIATTLEDYASHVADPAEKDLANQIAPAFGLYCATVVQMRALANEGRKPDAITLMQTQAFPHYEAFERAVRACREYNLGTAATADSTATRVVDRSRSIALGLTATALVLGAVLATLFSRNIDRTLSAFSAKLDQGAASLAAACSQIASSSQQLARGASEQAASLEEAGASLEEMSGQTNRTAECAARAKELAAQTSGASRAGTAEMGELNAALAATKTASDNIARIIDTIDGIAFQTNILALNAAVEAARAGESGAGFGVVADEVRALAQRSSVAARDIAEMITQARQKSVQGFELSAKLSARLDGVSDRIQHMDSLAAEIANSSREQSQGIGQVNLAIAQIDRVTQANASGAQQTASAAAEIDEQARALSLLVRELDEMIRKQRTDNKVRKEVVGQPHANSSPGDDARSTRSTTHILPSL